LEQFVTSPTFQVQEGKSTNVIDLVIAECRERVFTVVAHESPLSACEKVHHMLCFDYYLNAGDIALVEKKTRNYSKGNYGGMCDHFRHIDWPCVLDNKNVNESYDEFLQYYNRACDEFIPFRTMDD
jgi:hypothetical protein